jgi:hypothetical protein
MAAVDKKLLPGPPVIVRRQPDSFCFNLAVRMAPRRCGRAYREEAAPPVPVGGGSGLGVAGGLSSMLMAFVT